MSWSYLALCIQWKGGFYSTKRQPSYRPIAWILSREAAVTFATSKSTLPDFEVSVYWPSVGRVEIRVELNSGPISCYRGLRDVA